MLGIPAAVRQSECSIFGAFDLFNTGCSSAGMGLGFDSSRVSCGSAIRGVMATLLSVPSLRFFLNWGCGLRLRL
jgi:hypothetical protein